MNGFLYSEQEITSKKREVRQENLSEVKQENLSKEQESFSKPNVEPKEKALSLKDSFAKALPGDYVVLALPKTHSLLHIHSKKDNVVNIQEIISPEFSQPSNVDWRQWFIRGAPDHTSWAIYQIDLKTGRINHYYSFTKQNFLEVSEADNFLSKLLNLQFKKIPPKARKKIGPRPTSGPEWRPLWHPKMIVNGIVIKNVPFEAWQTRWPRDGSDLSGKIVDIYLPIGEEYLSYFPHWIQVSGAVKANVRAIDSGRYLPATITPPSVFLQPSENKNR